MSKKDWKKQLLRVKQIADQNLGRAEKSEVLSEELQNLEKRVDLIKQVYHVSSKKLLACSQGREGQEFEKRLRKMPEYNMAHSMKESSTMLKDDTLMGSMFNMCGDAEMILSTELLQHEIDVEKRVINPIQTLLEHDIPNIQRIRKHLTKLTLDMDSTRGRYDSAKRTTQGQGSKLEAIKDEMEEAHQRVESCKDQLSTELYSFMAKESDYSNLLLELINAQKTYHKRALEACERCIPRMEEQIEFHSQMPVFGCPLDDHLRRTGRDIAMVLEVCVCALLQIGLEEEGLFRIAGAATKAKKLRAAFDSGQVDVEDYVTDVPCIAGSLKLYLRELPEPLMTYKLYPEWMSAAHMPANQRMEALWHVVNKLPKSNYNNLRYLIKFLHKLSENQAVNKMSAANIAIVIGPNLIWPEGDGGPSVLTTSTQSAIVEVLITHADWFFPGDCDYHKTGKGMAASPPPTGLRRDRFLFPNAVNNGPVSKTPATATTMVTTTPVMASKTSVSDPCLSNDQEKPSPMLDKSQKLLGIPKDKENTHKDSSKENSLNAALSIAHKTLTAPLSSPVKSKRKTVEEPPIVKNATSTVESAKLARQRLRGSSVGRFETGHACTTPLNNSGDRSSIHGDSVSLGGSNYAYLPGYGAQSWRDKPVSVGKSASSNDKSIDGDTSTGPQNSSSTVSLDSCERGDDHRQSSASVVDDISDSLSEPGGAGSWRVRHYNSGLQGDGKTSRALTPPPRPTPPRAVHSDMYNTVFALQTLNGDGWSDYLTRVRGLWDGHMRKKSPGSSFNEGPDKDELKENETDISEGDGGDISEYGQTEKKTSLDDHSGDLNCGDPPANGIAVKKDIVCLSKGDNADSLANGKTASQNDLDIADGDGGDHSSTGENGTGQEKASFHQSDRDTSEGMVGQIVEDSESAIEGSELAGGNGDSREKSEMDFFETNNSSPAGTLKYSHPTNSHGDETAPTTAESSPPANHAAVITSSTVVPFASVPLSSSTGSLPSEGFEANDWTSNGSPRAPRRVKKTAPPPPPERPAMSTNTGVTAVTLNTPAADTPKFNLYPALPGPGGDSVPVLTISTPVEKADTNEKRPKIPERPQVVLDKPAVPERPSSPREVPQSPKSDRPKGPPPERPSVPPPEKPPPPSEKPSMPTEKPAAAIDKPPPLAEKPLSSGSKIDNSKPPLMEKPKSPKVTEPSEIMPHGASPQKQEIPAGTGGISPGTGSGGQQVSPKTSHKRQASTGSNRPPRPTPPPPPRHGSLGKETTPSVSEDGPPKPPERKDSSKIATEINTYL